MQLFCVRQVSGIRSTQVGKPLPHGCEGVTNCASSHRVTLLAAGSIAGCEDKEVEDFAFVVSERIEGRGLAVFFAERSPLPEDGVTGPDTLFGVGSSGELQSRLEISLEAVSDGRWCSSQGCGCG